MSTQTISNHKTLLSLVVLALVALAVLSIARTSDAEPPQGVEIEYDGRLLDEKRKPIAGIFPLEFMIYREQGADRPIWRETHWVAVSGGRYKVRLGSSNRIRADLSRDGKPLFLGVNLKNGAELTRETISLPKADVPAPASPAKVTEVSPGKAAPEKNDPVEKKPAPVADKAADKDDDKPQYKTEASFAELAEYAKRAGVAENAEKVGGKSIEELEAEIEKLRTLIAEMRTDKGGGVTVGSDTTVMPRVGGTGGTAYVRECPPGHVVTGIRGTGGALIDSIQLICSPLR